MKRVVLGVLVSVGLMMAANVPAQQKAYMDTETGPVHVAKANPGSEVTPLSITIAYEDSSRNQYTFWTQMQDPIFFSEDGNYIVFIFRGYEVDGTGFIACAASDNGGSNWVVARRINEAAGTWEFGGRYPSASLQAGNPISSHPELTSAPAWGYAADITGDWSGDPNNWYGEASQDIGAHKNIPIVLPDNQRILALISSATSGFMYGIYDAVNGYFELPPAVVDPGFYLVGGDILGNTAMAFGFDANGQLAYYTYDVNSGSWSGPTALQQVPVENLPNGEVLNVYDWADGIILNDGTPMMVVDMSDGSGVDTVYAGRTIWVVTPTMAVKVLDAQSTDPVWHVVYPQLSIDRATGNVFVFWNQLDQWYGDTLYGYGTWDIWYSGSSDGGATWSTPENLTATTGSNEGMFQVAKRVVNGRAWIAYLKAMGDIDGDLYCDVLTGVPFGGVWPTYDYLGYVDGLSVSESGNGEASVFQARLIGNQVRLTLPGTDNVELSIYDVTGRQIATETFSLNAGTHTLSLPTSTLNPGLYLVKVNANAGTTTLKLVRF